MNQFGYNKAMDMSNLRPQNPSWELEGEWELITSQAANRREKLLAERAERMQRQLTALNRSGRGLGSNLNAQMRDNLNRYKQELMKEDYHRLQNRWIDMRGKYKSAGKKMHDTGIPQHITAGFEL
jgi:hypothetical protein